MIEKALPRALLAAAMLFAPLYAAAQVAVPALSARVTDLTGTLTPDQRAALEARLASFESRKGSQVAVLMVPTTQPEAIEQYSIRVVEQWKLGRKGVDDGVLLLIAKNDRKLRIEVGQGLEGAIPDAIAKRIIAEAITPRFKEGDYNGGITVGIDRILRVIEGEPLPAMKGRPGSSRSILDYVSIDWLLFGIFVLIMLNQFLHSLFGRFLGAGVFGVAAGLIGYALASLMVVAVIAAIIAFVISLIMGANSGRGGWSSGGSWSSGSGGWSSGGGGFSGGGGGFSGGGASGSW